MKKDKIKSIESTNEDINYKIKDLSIKQLVPNIIDNYLITILDDHHTIFMPSNITGVQFKMWAQGRGGIFSKDVLYYTLNKNSIYTTKRKLAKYIHIKGPDTNCVARIINEEEKPQFESLKLIDGQIKDMTYMILKTLKNGEKLSNSNRYIEEKDVIHEGDIQIVISDSPKPIHDDETTDYHVESISLFPE
jgi:hypothetical protein